MIAISRTGRLLRRLVRLSCRRPVLTTVLSVVLAAAGIAYTLHSLTFKTSGRDLLPQNAGYMIAAYSVAAVILFGYALSLYRRTKRP